MTLKPLFTWCVLCIALLPLSHLYAQVDNQEKTLPPSSAVVVLDADEISAFNQRSGLVQFDGAETIDTFTGGLKLSYMDINWPGQGGLSMTVQRTYSGFKTLRKGFTDEFGMGWSINTMRLMPVTKTVYLKKHKEHKRTVSSYYLQMPGGNYKRFVKADMGLKIDQAYISDDNWRLQFSKEDEVATIQSPLGRQYILKRNLVGINVGGGATLEWTLTREMDNHGNFIDYDYDMLRGANRLTRMAANDGREIQFNYDRIHDVTILKSIRAGEKLWQYEFDQGQLQHDKGVVPLLHKVTRPDGLSTKYYYHCYKKGCQIRTLVHPTGGKTVYDYQTYRNNPQLQALYSKELLMPVDSNDTDSRSADSTSSRHRRFESIGKWRFHIPDLNAKTEQCGAQQCVTTTIVGPDRRTDYQHVVLGRRSDYMEDRGAVWQHGALVKETLYDNPKGKGQPLQVQTIHWEKQAISTDWQVYDQYIFDQVSHRALISKKEIKRDNTLYTTEYKSFDIYGQPQKVIETGPDGQLVHDFEYHHDQQNWFITAPAQKKTAGVGSENYSYDTKGRLTAYEQLGMRTEYSYDQSGQLSEKRDPLGRNWYYRDYHRGQAQTLIQPDGNQLKNTVDDYGRVTKNTDANGHTHHTQFDALDRIIQLTPPEGAVTKISYNESSGPGGQLVQRGDYLQTVRVDGFGRQALVRVSDSKRGELYTQQFAYDAYGRNVYSSQLYDSKKNEPLVGTFQLYDSLDRVVESGTKQEGTTLQSTRFDYLPKRSSKRTDPNGYVWLSRYRAINLSEPNRLLQHTDPQGNLTTIKRHLHGELLSVSQAGLSHHYQYNDRYHLIGYDTPEQGHFEYQRDIIGNKLSQKSADGETIEYRYDNMDRLVSTQFPEGHVTSQRYDANGNLLENNNQQSQWLIDYNANNQPIKATLTSRKQAYPMDYSYDSLGNLSSLIYPDGYRVDYAPNVLGQPQQVGQLIKKIDYTPFGTIKTLHYANNRKADFDYDSLQRLQSHQLQKGFSQTYQYDLNSNITRIDDSDLPGTPIKLDYDPIGQLTLAQGPWGEGRIAYDSTGNITQMKMGDNVLKYQYDSHNRLKSIGGTAPLNFTYDLTGNVIDDGSYQYTYNSAGELQQIDGAGTQVNQFDGFHHRIFSEHDDGITTTVFDRQHHLLFEHDEHDKLKRHIYLNGRIVAVVSNDEVEYHHTNHLGSLIAKTDKKGKVVARLHYYPFGAVFKGDANEARYTGKYPLDTSPLLDFAHRYYHPAIGRFMNVDPLSFNESNPMTFNRYSYAYNNPYNTIDPDGQFAFSAMMHDFFEGFFFGLSWGGDNSADPHAESFSFYIGAGVGAGVNISGIGSTLKGIGVAGKTGKYTADKLIKKQAKKKPIWAETTKHSGVDNAYSHWQKHQHEFPELHNAKQYVEQAQSRWLAGSQTMSTKWRANGDVLFYDMDSNTFSVFTAEGIPKTHFRPGAGAKYWGSQAP